MRTRLLLALLALGACADLQPTDSELTARDWAAPGAKRVTAPQAIWCYRTIGRPDCRLEPVPGQEHRLIEGGPQPPAAGPLIAPEPPPKAAAAALPAPTSPTPTPAPMPMAAAPAPPPPETAMAPSAAEAPAESFDQRFARLFKR